MTLQASDARRAAFSAGLLASDKDGEVVAAARALVGLLAKGGLEPRSVVAAGLATRAPTRLMAPVAAAPRRPWRERALMARYSPHLNKRERAFLNDVINWKTLSERQEAWLKAILLKSKVA